MAFTLQAASAADCRGSEDILAVTDWSAKQDELGLGLTIFLTVKNNSEASYLLIDGTTEFIDVLGSKIGRWELPRDVNLTPGKQSILEFSTFMSGARLLKASKQNVVATVCINAAITDTGAKVEFP
tara:strand:- start:6066 stop:6443 length:378 start_codon:yes stop_codon:yes gene_type:complete